MKKFLLSLAVLAGFAPAYAGTGTEADPYTVAEVLAMGTDLNVESAWVKGYIVGNATGAALIGDNSTAIWTATGASASNVLIADDASCQDVNQVVPIQLVANTDIRAAINLKDNPGNLGKTLTIQGQLIKYFSVPGIKAPTAYTLDGEGSTVTPSENVKVADIAAFKAGKDANATYEFTSPVTAIYQNGSYLYTQDASGYLLIYGQTGQTYAKGDVIPAGFTGKYSVFHEGAQLASPAGFAASTAKAEVTPTEIALEEIGTDMVNDYVKLEGVTIAGGKISQDGTELAIYDSFKINPADGENLTVLGFVSWYNALQIVPIEVTDASGEVIEKVAAPVFTPGAGAVYADTEVTIACATEGAEIHYTTDGTEPTAASALYSAPIVVTEDVTLKAIAVKADMESSDVVTAVYTIREFVAGDYLGEFNTFNEGKTSTAYITSTNATGWTAENCAIMSGSDTPDTASNPAYSFIGDSKTLAPTMNGKTTAVGKITSPVLENGIKDLSFSYGLPFADTKIDFTVTVYAEDGTTVVATQQVAPENVEKQTAYDFKLDNINHNGKFKIELVNNSPSNSTSNKDRTAVWNLTWTAYSSAIESVAVEAENAPVEYYNLQGVRVAAPEAGIFIRRQGSKVEKVVVR